MTFQPFESDVVAADIAALPFAPWLSLVLERAYVEANNLLFGQVNDENGNPIAFLREHFKDNLRSGLHALVELSHYDVTVANHLPFVGPNGKELLLVEYVNGQSLDETYQNIDPTISLKLALSLGKYIIDGLIHKRPTLNDVIAPFQYNMRGEEPVLTDLDMHLGDAPETNISVLNWLDERIKEIKNDYMLMLPQDLQVELSAGLRNMELSAIASLC